MAKRKTTVYTDGSCLGNPGPGGWGAIIETEEGEREYSGGFGRTTNNRMELYAVIMALRELKEPGRLRLYSDSQYFCNAVNKGWLRKWRNNGWKTSKGPVANLDLWKEALALMEPLDIAVVWIKGHADNPKNSRCDELARAAAGSGNLMRDKGYEEGA